MEPRMRLPLAILYLVLIVSAQKNHTFTFPQGFLFGAGTSAYQTEGAHDVDGKGQSIWDTHAHEHPDRIADGSNGDDAAKSYYKYKEDIKAIKEMGSTKNLAPGQMQIYRFSISWPRIMPLGLPNNINQKGIDHYNSVINEVLSNNLIPLVTIYHWDLPQHLQDLGGFANDDIIIYYEAYANLIFENFGDRVKWWCTINEPYYQAFGYDGTIFAPGINSTGIGGYLAAHNMIKAHARVYHLYEKQYRSNQKGRISLNLPIDWPAPRDKNSTQDQEAAKIELEFSLGWFAHPIYSKEGDYPQVMKDRISNFSLAAGFPFSRLPSFTSAEIEYIRGTADYFALNQYGSKHVAKGEQGPDPSFDRDSGVIMTGNKRWPSSRTSKWETITPKGLRDIIAWIRKEYGEEWEILITENGFADGGQLNDVIRVEYLATYMTDMLKAIYIDKCKVIGYIVWSLIDSFEWMSGYTSSFGLYQVDFNDPERKRTPKQSAYFMANITRTREIPTFYTMVTNKLDKLEGL